MIPESPQATKGFGKMFANIHATRVLIAALAVAVCLSAQAAAYTTSLGADNRFVEPAGWSVGDVGSTYQQWDHKTTGSGNTPDVGLTVDPSGLTTPTHSVKAPGAWTGSDNFYSFAGDHGATADIYNHGGGSGSGSYAATFGTHVIVQTGSSVNGDTGIGNRTATMQITDLAGDAITGGDNASALRIDQVSFQPGVSTFFGPVDYQEFIYEFYLPGYTGDFRVDWVQSIHSTIDTLRVDSMIVEPTTEGSTPFETTAVPEPATLGLVSLGGLVLLRRRRA